MGQSTEKKQSVFEHLTALRNVLVVTVGTVLIAFFVIFSAFIKPLMALIEQPIVNRGVTIIFSAPAEMVTTQMKVSIVAAIIVAFPVITWQVWRFIRPALYQNERRAFWGLFVVTVFLFLLGVAFCYFAVYNLALEFFITAAEGLATPMLSIDKYVGFLFGFVVPFGLAFELPVVLYTTTRMGLTNYQMLASKRKFIILAVAVIAAILTPPDVVSQVMLGIPILILFEISLIIVRVVGNKQKKV